jgi:hypothetical protein
MRTIKKQVLKLTIAMAITLALSLGSCATFPRQYKNDIRLIQKNELAKLDGHYKITPVLFVEDSSRYNSDLFLSYNNAFEKFYRDNKGRSSRDTLKIVAPNLYSFKIKVLDDKKLQVTYLKDNIPFRTISFKYRFTKDRYLLIKNRNFKISGLIPYVVGGFDVKRRRLATDGKDLIIEESHESSGAFLLVFGDSKVWHTRFKYEKIQ